MPHYARFLSSFEISGGVGFAIRPPSTLSLPLGRIVLILGWQGTDNRPWTGIYELELRRFDCHILDSWATYHDIPTPTGWQSKEAARPVLGRR